MQLFEVFIFCKYLLNSLYRNHFFLCYTLLVLCNLLIECCFWISMLVLFCNFSHISLKCLSRIKQVLCILIYFLCAKDKAVLLYNIQILFVTYISFIYAELNFEFKSFVILIYMRTFIFSLLNS